MIDKIPIASLHKAVSYLDLNSIENLIQTSKYFVARLPVLRRIIKAMKDHSIYENEALLNEVYSNHQQLVVNWMDIRQSLQYDQPKVTQKIFKKSNKILKFNNWEELYQCHDYFNVIRFTGVCKILAPQSLDSDHDKTYALICTASSGPIQLLSNFLKDPRFDYCKS